MTKALEALLKNDLERGAPHVGTETRGILDRYRLRVKQRLAVVE
jgi:hypothetical protein